MISTVIFLILLRLNVLASALVHSHWRREPGPFSSRADPSLLRGTAVDVEGGVLHTYDITDATRESEAHRFRADLDDAGLTKCHGILHASGCRRVSDLGRLTTSQITSMGTDPDDTAIINAMADQSKTVPSVGNNAGTNSENSSVKLSTMVDDGVYIPEKCFNFEVVCAKNEIYKGRLFTVDQCNQLKRMSEYHAYKVNSEWIGMACKSIPGFISTTDDHFHHLFRELYCLFPGTMRRGSIQFESDNEPHLVRYIGEATGAPLHIDTTHKSITINVLLSDNGDFGGGGTYLKAIDKTIKLEQGEVLIHPGNLEHAGADITFGVRQLLVAFLECEWEDSVLPAAPLL